MWYLLGFSAAIWTTFVFLSAYVYQDKPCMTSDKWACWGRLAYVPWILITVFLFWLGGLVYFAWTKKPQLGQSKRRGPDFVTHSLAYFPIVVLAPVLLTTIGAFKDGQYTISLLNAAGVIIFLYGVRESNVYRDSRLIYNADCIRIPLAADFDPGTVYILPSANYGFDAIFSRRIESEHLALDEFKKDLEQLNPTDNHGEPWIRKCCSGMRSVIIKHNKNVPQLRLDELNYLARWLCCMHQTQPQPIRCRRIPGGNLINRELIMALLHCESLVHGMYWRLDPEVQEEIQKLRPGKYSEPEKKWKESRRESTVTFLSKASSAGAGSLGMSVDDKAKEPVVNVVEVKSQDGEEGFLAAAKRVYDIFGEEGFDLKTFTKDLPTKSIAVPHPIDNYVGKLWDKCYAVDPSTFGALYLWASVWEMDMGYSNGYHIAPFESDTRHYYLSSWLISWRGIWFMSILSQGLTMLPTILSSFLSAAIS